MTSRIALGTVQFGQSYGIANSSGQVAAEVARKIVDYARSAGIDTLDTAVIYGSAEQLLGNIGVSDFKVVTKVPALNADVVSPGRWMLEQVEASIARLRVKRLYGLLLHHPADLLGPNGATVAAQLSALKTLGLVEKIGVSIYAPSDLDYVTSRLDIDIVQAPMSVFDRRMEVSGWLERLAQQGIEVHARSLFLQGLLLMPPARLPEQFKPWQDRMQAWHTWLETQQTSAVNACVAHAASHTPVSRMVVGCDRLEQLEEIVYASNQTGRSAPLDFQCNDEGLINPATWNKL